jgi:hypothetical protein
MRKFIPGYLIITLTALILILISCSAGSCFEKTESFIKVSFYNYKTQKIKAPDSLTIYVPDMANGIIYNKATGVQPALLPLNPATVTCTFVVRINGKNDTIEFRYSSYPHLISKECGFTYYHSLDTDRFFTKHAIINMYIGNRNITTVNEENIRIFY